MSECSLYVIIKMRDGLCLKALHIVLLKFGLTYVSMLFMWYY